MGTNVEDFFGAIMHSRDMAHLMHLKSKSYAEHVALDGFYSAILGISDGLIECYQGCYGLLDITIPQSTAYSNPVEYFVDLKEYIIDCKDSLFSESFILNVIDEILALISQTIYKLKFLK